MRKIRILFKAITSLSRLPYSIIYNSRPSTTQHRNPQVLIVTGSQENLSSGNNDNVCFVLCDQTPLLTTISPLLLTNQIP